MTAFVVSEGAVAARVGATRRSLRDARRRLEQGVDWALVAGEVRLTELGAERLVKALAGPGPAVAAVVEAAVAGSVPGVEKLLRVEGRTRNKHIVMAWVDEPAPSAELVRVQVPDSKNFCEGQRIRCVHVEEDLWELVGRAPRSRRDWLKDDHQEEGPVASASPLALDALEDNRIGAGGDALATGPGEEGDSAIPGGEDSPIDARGEGGEG